MAARIWPTRLLRVTRRVPRARCNGSHLVEPRDGRSIVFDRRYTVITAVTAPAASIAARTTSWNRPASNGDSPPNSAPTNAPGRTTSPVVLVWSTPGTSASCAAMRPSSRVACRASAPSASHPSAQRSRRSCSNRRPASEATVMPFPITMAPTAKAYRGVNVTAPVRNTPAPPTATPTAIDSAPFQDCANGSPARRPDTATATVNITHNATPTPMGSLMIPPSTRLRAAS